VTPTTYGKSTGADDADVIVVEDNAKPLGLYLPSKSLTHAHPHSHTLTQAHTHAHAPPSHLSSTSGTTAVAARVVQCVTRQQLQQNYHKQKHKHKHNRKHLKQQQQQQQQQQRLNARADDIVVEWIGNVVLHRRCRSGERIQNVQFLPPRKKLQLQQQQQQQQQDECMLLSIHALIFAFML